MGTLSWDRSADLVIGTPGSQGARITGGRITFAIEKTARSSANTATITAYNLGENNRKRMQTKDSSVILQVGYGGLLEVLFAGQVTRGSVRREPPDWLAQADCRDGQTALRDSTLARTWPAGTSRLSIVRELTAALMGVAAGVIEGGPLIGFTAAPLSVSGSVRRSLDARAADWGFSWYIVDGSVEVRELGKRSPGYVTAVLLTPETGLLGSPEWTEDGLSLRALLTPRIKPGGYVQVKSRVVQGVFRVQSCRHSGDTHGAEWVTEAVCQEVS